MNRLGGEFYYNDTKITYAKAQKLIKEYEDLNVKTPYPYGTPPKTFISKELIDKVNTQKPVTKKEIAIYNKLAIKYNKDPEGIIKQGEVIRMYDIYSRMTPKQKKAAQPYPVLPPPPPPPPAAPTPAKKTTYVIKSEEKDKNSSEPVILEIRETGEVDEFEENEIEIIEVVEQEEEIDINNLIKQGATFYLNDKKISNSKAKKLFKNTSALATIDVSKSPNKNPIVNITTK
jgi:hypothetical protein